MIEYHRGPIHRVVCRTDPGLKITTGSTNLVSGTERIVVNAKSHSKPKMLALQNDFWYSLRMQCRLTSFVIACGPQERASNAPLSPGQICMVLPEVEASAPTVADEITARGDSPVMPLPSPGRESPAEPADSAAGELKGCCLCGSCTQCCLMGLITSACSCLQCLRLQHVCSGRV